MTDARLTGRTRLHAIVGDSIEQMSSPEVFTPRFEEAGVDAVLVPLHVPVAMDAPGQTAATCMAARSTRCWRSSRAHRGAAIRYPSFAAGSARG